MANGRVAHLCRRATMPRMSAAISQVAIEAGRRLAATTGYPDEHDLCEQCGYPLRGLSADGACPECGKPIAESDPARRTGLPWQNERSVGMWLRTAAMIALRPKHGFQQLRIDRVASVGRAADRWHLVSYACLVGALWLLCFALAGGLTPLRDPLLKSTVATMMFAGPALAVIGLSYIEALGVAWFSRRRGWRVAFRLAERVVCYSAIGWLPAGIVCCLAYLWYGRHLRLPLPTWLFPGDFRDLFVLTLIGSVSILWFETLVWLGVREVKFANGR